VLDSFVGWQAASGKIVGLSLCTFHRPTFPPDNHNTVLDEAHKFLTSNEASRLNQSLANTIRLQRHLATRVIIATQEPTVIPPTILDLSSFIICHRFSSPSWCAHLAKHVNDSQSQDTESWFQQVMLLGTGEGIVFSPTALVSVKDEGEVELLGGQFLKVKVRPRITQDGGQSLLAVGRTLAALDLSSIVEPVTDLAQATAPVAATQSSLADWTSGPPSAASFAAWQPPAAIQLSHLPTPRQLPAHLRPFIDGLIINRAAAGPISLKGFRRQTYSLVGDGRGKMRRWETLLREVMSHRDLIQVKHLDLSNSQLKEIGQTKTIMLLDRGPFLYV